MTDMISRDRAVSHINDMADKIASRLGPHEYSQGYLDGFRTAGQAIAAMLSDRDAAIIAEIQAERANA